MKTKLLILILAFLFFNKTDANAQINAELLVNIHSVTASEMNNISSPSTGSLAFNTSNKKLHVYDGANWNPLGTSLIEVINTAALTYNFTPPNNSAYHKLDGAIPPTTVNVFAGDIIDVSLQLAADYNQYNSIGDIVKFYITIDGTNISDPIFSGLITGGDNKLESGYASLNQSFKITTSGELKVGVLVKTANTTARVYAPNSLGKGGLNLMIYR